MRIREFFFIIIIITFGFIIYARIFGSLQKVQHTSAWIFCVWPLLLLYGFFSFSRMLVNS